MHIARSASFFFRGPVWRVGSAAGGLVTVVGVVQALETSSLSTLWMWLFFASLALVAAAFYSFHRNRMEIEAKKELLPHKIDDLQREGKALLAELETPVEPETKDGVTTISGEWASDEWWGKVEAFEKRIRELFIARYPALLSDYANGANEHLRKRREASETAGASAVKDKRSDAEKMLALANEMRSDPAKRMEASLEGLTAARHRLGAPHSI